MAEPMSVSMTVRIVDEASAQARGITSAIRDLTAAGGELNGSNVSRVGAWNDERGAVALVATEVRALGGLRQDTSSIAAATSAYREQAAAVEGVAAAEGATRERLVDVVKRQAAERRAAFHAAQAAETAGAEAAIGKLDEEAAAVEGVTARLRELQAVARTSVPSIPLAPGGGEAETGGIPPQGPPPPRIGGPSPDEEPRATRPPPPVTGGGSGLVDMILGGAELGSGLHLIRGSFEQAADAAGQRAAMRAAGIPDAEAGTLSEAARRVSRQRRVFDENETLEMVRDARTVLGSTPHAVEALPDLVDLATIAEAQRPGEGREGIMALVKGMETSGATSSPEQFHALGESLAKVTNVFGKTIDFTAWGQYFKYGGTAAQHFSPEFTEQKLPHLIQELGGSSTGTMLQTMERAIVEGRMDAGAIRTMRQYGMLDESKVHEAHGKFSLDAGAVRGADAFLKDPSQWVQSILRPALDAAHLSEGERASMTGKMFSSRLTERGMAILENQDAIVQKDAAEIRQAHGLKAASDLARTDPHLVTRALEAQTRNTEQRAGAPVLNPLLGIENWFASSIGRLNDNFFDKVPGSATAAVAGAVGAAGYMGWKTWEHGFANTARDAIRLPADAAQGLVQGVVDGLRQARAEAAQPTAVRAGAAVDAASVAARAGGASEQLGTIGMMIAWAMQQDRGTSLMRHSPTDEELARVRDASHDPLLAQLDARLLALDPSRHPSASGQPAGGEPASHAPTAAPVAPPVEAMTQAIRAMVDPIRSDIRTAIEGAKANMASPRPTAADQPQQVTNNQQRYITAPVSVTAPITINATLNNTTPAAIASTVSGGVAAGVRAGAGALHDGPETR